MLKIAALMLCLLVQTPSALCIPSPLSIGKSHLCMSIPSRIGDALASGQCCERQQANIDPNFLTRTWECSRRNVVAGEDGIPPFVLAPDRHSLDRAKDFPVNVDPHQPDILNSEFPIQSNAIAIRGENNRIPSLASLETWEACSTTFHSTEESVEGFLQSAQNILTRRIVQRRQLGKSVAEFLQFGRLIVIVQGELSASPCIPPLFQRKVIEHAASIQQGTQAGQLGAVRIEAIFERAAHLLSFLRFDITLDRFCADIANRGGIVRTRPEGRKPRLEGRKLFPQFVRSESFQPIRNLRNRPTRVAFDEHVYVIGHDL